MTEDQAQRQIATVYQRVTARPRDYLERVEQAAREWAALRGKQRCHAHAAERKLMLALESFHIE